MNSKLTIYIFFCIIFGNFDFAFGRGHLRPPLSGLHARYPTCAQDGDGEVTIGGEKRVWHTLTFTLSGPFARERDDSPNPFRDYRCVARFVHEDSTEYSVPGYFAADGDAANTSADSGNQWRFHFTPDRPGKWTYRIKMFAGRNAAIEDGAKVTELSFSKSTMGNLSIADSNKRGRDLRAHGRLRYVGKRYLQFAGSGKFFLKVGADAPETLLGYQDFDGTVARKKNVPLKRYRPHLADWRQGDPTWQAGKGKGLIGAINYLSSKGCNAFSFLTYNAGGDGDNVWPHLTRTDKLHFDCSKLDQWRIVFDHATTQGMYLHFKLQETENDDNNQKGRENVPMALDGGELGVERKLYLRELIARFGHNLALNWNLGEENTQTTLQQQQMANYIKGVDPYDSLIVVHTFPDQQEKVYLPLLGGKSELRGASLQNSHIRDTHRQTLRWVQQSEESGVPWVIAFDESGSAAHGVCPDLGYQGFDGHDNDGKYVYTQHQVRRQTLWGNLMAGGAGVEYYFGYQFAENDLNCEDWRSRDQSWDYCRFAIEFFERQKIPVQEMSNRNALVGNSENGNSCYCFAKPGEIFVVYLASDKLPVQLDLQGQSGRFEKYWFNPRNGKKLASEAIAIDGGRIDLKPPSTQGQDWVFVLKKMPKSN